MEPNNAVDESNSGSFKAQIFAAIASSYLCISAGNVLGYSSPAIPSMRISNSLGPISEYDIAWIGSLVALGGLVGGLVSVFFLKYFGTRKTILFFALPSFLVSWLSIGAFNLLEMILFGRFLGGLASGITISSSFVYVTDVASLKRRGSLGVIPSLFLSIGILLVYVIGTYLDWHYLAITCGFISMPALILLLLAPDTPTWLIKSNRIKSGKHVLEKLHGKDVAETKFNEIEAQLNLQDDTTEVNLDEPEEQESQPKIEEQPEPRSCFAKFVEQMSNIFVDRAFVLALGLMALPQLVGINFVTFYGEDVFKNSIGDLDPNIPCILFAATQVIGTLITISIIEKFGRKILLLISTFFVGVCSAILAIYFYIGTTYKSTLFWIPLVALPFYVFFFCLGLGAITGLICVEILRKETSPIQNPLLIGFMWFCSFLVTYFGPLLEKHINLYGVFGIFSTVAFLGVLFIALLVPETKGKSSAELRSVFEKKP